MGGKILIRTVTWAQTTVSDSSSTKYFITQIFERHIHQSSIVCRKYTFLIKLGTSY